MATNPYTTQAIGAAYNLNPPPDDGTQVTSNIISWNGNNGSAGIKVKLADPLVTYGQNINAQCLAAFAQAVVITADNTNAMAGSLSFSESTLTVASNAITPTRSAHAITNSGGSPSDLVNTINTTGVSDGALLLLRRFTSGQLVTIKHATNNVFLSGSQDFALQNDGDFLLLRRLGSNWYQVGGSYVAAPVAAGVGTVQLTFYQALPDTSRCLYQISM